MSTPIKRLGLPTVTGAYQDGVALFSTLNLAYLQAGHGRATYSQMRFRPAIFAPASPHMYLCS